MSRAETRSTPGPAAQGAPAPALHRLDAAEHADHARGQAWHPSA